MAYQPAGEEGGRGGRVLGEAPMGEGRGRGRELERHPFLG